MHWQEWLRLAAKDAHIKACFAWSAARLQWTQSPNIEAQFAIAGQQMAEAIAECRNAGIPETWLKKYTPKSFLNSEYCEF